LVIERERTFDAQVTTVVYLFIEIGAKFLKIFEAVGHWLLRGHA
jgi:hypothetical protein